MSCNNTNSLMLMRMQIDSGEENNFVNKNELDWCTPSDAILDMCEDQYNDLVEQCSLNKIRSYLIMDQDGSRKQYDWIKNVYRWSSKKEYSHIRENANINYDCVSTILGYLSSKLFDASQLKTCDITSIVDDEIFEEFIISKKLTGLLLTDWVFAMIHLYPADKFEHYCNLILEYYNLPKVFDDAFTNPPFYEYSLDTLNIIVNAGVKLNFEELLIQCCQCSTRNCDDLTDKIYYALDNLEINNLSCTTLAIVYSSPQLETIISKVDSEINFSLLGPIHLIGNMNRDKMNVLTKYGYDFKEMLGVSASGCMEHKYFVDDEKTDQSKYLGELLEDINFDNNALKQMLHAMIYGTARMNTR